MKFIKLPALFILSVFFVVSACSKYEEGKPSMASKKSRLVNNWKVQQLTANGNDITSWNLVEEVIITKNNTITVSGTPFGVPTTTNGAWAFNSDKTHVLVTNNDGSLDDYEIVMLQKDESKFRLIDNGTTYLYHLVSK